jgi:hypothetical protein
LKNKTVTTYYGGVSKTRQAPLAGRLYTIYIVRVKDWAFLRVRPFIVLYFLNQHKQEVMKMLVTEWDYDLEKEVLKEEAHEKGLPQGREEERAILVNSLYENGLTVAQIVKGTNLSETAVKKILGV